MRPSFLRSFLLCLVATAPGQAQRGNTRDPFQLAQAALDRRTMDIAAIHSEAGARERQRHVREIMRRLIGPLPTRTPLNPVVLGETVLPGLRIQKVLFDSQPGFHVTALLYLPDHTLADRALPAIVITPGHQPTGKLSDYPYAVALVRNGFAVLSYDPLGQGERLQYPDPANPADSLAGHPTGEHGEASLQPILIGESIAKYFLWDAMSAVDYLLTRPEVDGSRIGAFGCSGGGADTALLGALDSRIKAIGTACYLTSFETLLPAIGPQDAEQSTPGWIAAGLDFPDYVEAAAPTPYAILATEADMFPFAGAKTTAAESRRFYDLFTHTTGTPIGALTQPASSVPAPASPLAFITGPGGHANLKPILPRIVKFFTDALQPAGFAPIYDDQSPEVIPPPSTFQVTSTGQVSTFDPNAATVFSLSLQHAQSLPQPHPADLPTLQRSIREVTGSQVMPLKPHMPEPGRPIPGEPYDSSAFPGLIVKSAGNTPGLSRWSIRLPRTDGSHLSGLLLVPQNTNNPALHLLLSRFGEEDTMAPAVGKALASHDIVFVVTPEPAALPARTESKYPLLGPWYIPGLGLELVHRTILGQRLDDVLLATNYLDNLRLAHLPGVHAEASGHLALVLLHAAVLDARLTTVDFSNLPETYAQLLADPMPRDAPEDILPGVLLYYDIPDLFRFAAPRGAPEPSGNSKGKPSL